jgi:casein kinase II subunit alpha
MKMSKLPRVYANVLKNYPKEYWDYENYQFQWNDQSSYEIIKKVGRGKYSEVFEGLNTKKNQKSIF